MSKKRVEIGTLSVPGWYVLSHYLSINIQEPAAEPADLLCWAPTAYIGAFLITDVFEEKERKKAIVHMSQ